MTRTITLMILVVLCASVASASSVYVEDGLLWKNTSGIGGTANSDFVFDGNYSTFGSCRTTDGQNNYAVWYINYSNIGIDFSDLYVFWQVKYDFTPSFLVNLTLPTNCITSDSVDLYIQSLAYRDGSDSCGVRFKCYNGTEYQTLLDTYVARDPCGEEALIFEEGLFFNYTVLPSVQDQTFAFLGAYAAIGIGLIVAYSFFSQGRKKRR